MAIQTRELEVIGELRGSRRVMKRAYWGTPMRRFCVIAILSATMSGCVTVSKFDQLHAEHEKTLAMLTARDAMIQACTRDKAEAEQKAAKAGKGWNVVPVLVAAQDVAENTVITLDMLAQRAVPEQFVTSSVVKPDSAAYIVNQKLLVPVKAGDPLLWSQFEVSQAAEKISKAIEREKRLVTIETTSSSASGGQFVRPNDRVDIIATLRDPKTNETTATTVVENMQVVATGKISGRTNVHLVPEAERGYTTLSLLASPEEAEKLVLAQELGRLTVVLRNAEDMSKRARGGGVNVQHLLRSAAK